MDNRHLFYFIGKCLTLSEVPERITEVQQELVKEDFPWEQLVWVSSSHFVTPALYVKFRDAGLLDLLPPDLAEYLGQLYALNLQRNNRIIQQALEITGLLSAEKIGVIFMKGLALILDGTYIDRGERVFVDIDLLIRPGALEKAAALLMAEGYLPDDSIDEVISHRAHFPSLSHPEMPAPVELHHYPVNLKYNRHLNYDMVADQKIRLDDFPGAYTVSVETNLTISFMHSQLKDHGQLFALPMLRDLFDVYHLTLKGEIPPDIPACSCFGRTFNNYMALCHRVFGTDRFAHRNNTSARFYLWRVERNLNSRSWYHCNRFLLYPFVQLPRYVRAFVRFFTSGDSRKILFAKLRNPAWYRAHFGRYWGG